MSLEILRLHNYTKIVEFLLSRLTCILLIHALRVKICRKSIEGYHSCAKVFFYFSRIATTIMLQGYFESKYPAICANFHAIAKYIFHFDLYFLKHYRNFLTILHIYIYDLIIFHTIISHCSHMLVTISRVLTVRQEIYDYI